MNASNGVSNRVNIMNKPNRRFAAAFAVAFGVLTAAACDQGLTEVNENPNAPEVVPVENLLLKGIWDVSANNGGRGTFGQWTQMYHGENWAQHLGQPIYNDEDRYTPRTNINQNIWDEMYFALLDLNEAKSLAAADGQDNIWAVAEIMTVYGFMILTDYFGDIPYMDALSLLADDPVAFPSYTAQSTIYPDLIARLVGAAARINTGAVVTFGDFDPVYQGDMAGWKSFANSLRLRLAMRMSSSSAAAAQTAFSAAWAAQRFSSVADHADVDWQATPPAANPVYEAVVFSGRLGDFRLSESFVDRLAAFNDPRLAIYAEPAASDDVFRGLRNGRYPGQYSPPLGSSDFSTIGAVFLNPTNPSVLISYAETLFLGAEAAELGWIGDVASVLYADGITASMEEFGIDAADIATYLAQAEVDYTTGTYAGLDAIHVQKWMALFLAGPEAFSELRRVGWDWTTAAGTTGLDLIAAESSVLAAGVFPERMTYPSKEALVNSDKFPGVIDITVPVGWAN